jgi:hypothetical protein
LNQVGSTNNYIAGQIQKAMLGVASGAAAAGLAGGGILLVLLNGLSRQSRMGLLANMGLDGGDWLILLALAASLVIMTIWITRSCAMKLLGK